MSIALRLAAVLVLLSANVAVANKVRGDWSSLGEWPLIAVHAVLTPDGRVLTYGTDGNGSQTGKFIYDVWDPAAGGIQNGHLTLPNGTNTDIFCSSQVILPGSGDIFIAGGDNFVGGSTTNTANNNSNVFNTSNLALARGNNMKRSRWYSSSITLVNGETYIQGGKSGTPYPEVRSSSGVFRALSSVDTSSLASRYPRNFVAPDGRVFGYDEDGRMYYVNTAGAGSIALGAQLPGPPRYPSSAVMFRPGRILQIGGNTTASYLIDINGSSPAVTTTQQMSSVRYWVTATVIADGRVIATGGSAKDNLLTGVNNTASIWDPDTGQWTQGEEGHIARLYHSTALLLPDATMLVAGGGAQGPLTNLNAEIYYPPYLYNSSGGFAARPVIDSAPNALALGQDFSIDASGPDSIARVTLVKTGSVTHSFNMDQRFIELSFSHSGGPLHVQAPTVAGVAPPGYYLLFVIDSKGVPSVAKIVRMNIGGGVPPPPPPPPPTFTLNPLPLAPPEQSENNVTYTASVDNPAGVTFSWFFDDGTPQTAPSSSPTISHTFTQPGVYYVTVTASRDGSPSQTKTLTQMIHLPLTALPPTASGNVAYEAEGNGRVWIVNQDNDSVSVFNAATNSRVAEIGVGTRPRAVAVAPDGKIWVTNKLSGTISVIDSQSLQISRTITLPNASQPFGLAFSPDGNAAYVVLEALGQVLKLNPTTGAQLDIAAVGANPRHLSISANGATIYVARFISPPLAGEGTANVQTSGGGQVAAVNAGSMTVVDTIELRVSTKPDADDQGSGLPNYLGAPVISPDGLTAWVPSKQDNVGRGTLRIGRELNFQNTVRAISSRIELGSRQEDFSARIDHDNSSVASAAAFEPFGVYLFVALETSREVAVIDAYRGLPLFRFPVGRAPQGLAVSRDGKRLYVNNFMDRTLGIFDLKPLIEQGESTVPPISAPAAVGTEKLSPKVLKGKQFFYDAKDARLARDAYLSCASCHNDGGHDGRVWDLTGFGEGLRNTVALQGRAGAQGFLHWSGNFDEVQDFEGQIRNLAGGTGLMGNAAFNTGTRSQPLGDAKAGVSSDLDALAAYVQSLATFMKSPLRTSTGALTTTAEAGKALFSSAGCSQCHAGTTFTESGSATLRNIGTIKPSSGKRLDGPLTGIDTPTLRDAWATAPYLHDGSAATLADAVSAHSGISLGASDLSKVVAYVEQIGSQESSAPGTDSIAPTTPPNFAAALASGKPKLTWGASSDNVGVTQYAIFRSTDGTLGNEVARTTARSWIDPSFAEGVTYTYAVKAFDGAGNASGATALKSVLVNQVKPSAPTSFDAALNGAGDPVLSWSGATDNVGVTGYFVYRSTSTSLGSQIATTGTTSWTDSTAVAGKTYTYSVKAFDAAGNVSARSPSDTIKAQ